MRTGTKLNDGGPYRNMFFASVTYNNDLAPFQVAAPEGLKNLAQGFNPGKHPIKRFALKGREMAWAKCPSNATENELGIS